MQTILDFWYVYLVLGIIACSIFFYINFTNERNRYDFEMEEVSISVLLGFMTGVLFIGIPLLYYVDLNENKKKQQTPVLVNVGNVDGCNVKFYDNGVSKFYLARCGNVETRTEEVRRGKFTELVTTIIKND